jgi:hypothetical protein
VLSASGEPPLQALAAAAPSQAKTWIRDEERTRAADGNLRLGMLTSRAGERSSAFCPRGEP